MPWVKSEYAGELAVLSTWLVAVAPWSVSIFGAGNVTGVVFRFLPARIQYLFGIAISNELTLLSPWGAATVQQGDTPLLTYLWTAVTTGNGYVIANLLWTAALLVFAVTFAASLAYYTNEEQFVERFPLDPVRFFGGALGVVGLLLLAGTVLLNLRRGFVGTTIPVGAIVAPVLAAVLLTADRT